MPNFIELDSSAREENPTIIIGKNILLKIIENPDKKALLSESLVKKFVSVSNLANEEVKSLINELMVQEAYMTAPSFFKVLLKNKDALNTMLKGIQPLEKFFAPIKACEIFKTSSQDNIPFSDSIEKRLKEDTELFQDFMFHIKGEIKPELIEKHEKKLLELDREVEKKIGMRLTQASTLFVCPKCSVVVFPDELKAKKCLSCGAEVSQENVKRFPIYKIPDEIKVVWMSNLWFEAYMANLLRKIHFQTWTGIHAMGASGILHEVDVLAIRDGALVICECKTGKVSRNNVFNFCTKVNDLKAHVSILAMLGELPEPDTRKFLKRNLAIIRLENMGKIPEKELIADLRKRLNLKA